MLKYFFGLITVFFVLTACDNAPAELDHGDPASVAKTMIAAARDRDLETLAYTFHPDHENGMRQALLATLGEDVDPINRFAPEDWDMFAPEKKTGPRYEVLEWLFERPEIH